TFNNSAVNYTLNNASGNVGIMGSTGILKKGTGVVTFNSSNTYSGGTTISAGTLVANSNGAFSGSTITLGDVNTTANGSSPTLFLGGGVNLSNPVVVSSNVTTGTYKIGGNTDGNSTFGGAIVQSQDLTISQVPTTGNNALNINGGIATNGNNVT